MNTMAVRGVSMTNTSNNDIQHEIPPEKSSKKAYNTEECHPNTTIPYENPW
jgi:hypothetical protein